LCEQIATDLLASQNITTSKIDVQNLKYNKTIVFSSIQNYCKITGDPIEYYINPRTKLLKDGCTIIEGGIYVVLYNDKNQSQEHLNWTLAHEIGHIYMGHIADQDNEEIEAHFFAAQYLMPEYSLIQMQTMKNSVLTATDIYNVFNVSWTAANKRISTLKRKCAYRCCSSDKIIWNNMKDDIFSYFNQSDFHNPSGYSIRECEKELSNIHANWLYGGI
jgi:hypothetical protein